jgi:hypothetical protein
MSNFVAAANYSSYQIFVYVTAAAASSAALGPAVKI